MRYCIGLTKAKTVLDPFMGSGTTLRACKDLGFDGTGIEINPDYVKIAQDRLKQEVLL
jgi:site-specific DNA-methyltransferase (adenine-specific)